MWKWEAAEEFWTEDWYDPTIGFGEESLVAGLGRLPGVSVKQEDEVGGNFSSPGGRYVSEIKSASLVPHELTYHAI